MSDLLQKLKLGTDNVKLIDIPGSTQKVALRILSQKDLQQATFNTERLFKAEKIDINMVSANEYDSEKATQILFMSLRDPENLDEPIAKNITEFRSALSKSVKEYIIDEYVTFEKDCNPTPDILSNDEFDKLVSDLKKKPLQINGYSGSTATLKKLIITLASQPVTLPQDNG